MPNAIVWNLQFDLIDHEGRPTTFLKRLELACAPVPGIHISDPAFPEAGERKVVGVVLYTQTRQFSVNLPRQHCHDAEEFEIWTKSYKSHHWQSLRDA